MSAGPASPSMSASAGDGATASLDGPALRRLDELLSLDDDAAREHALEALRATHPALHERVRRLLAASAQPTRGMGLAASIDAIASGATALREGQLVGPYALVRELGRGGMSVVWLARRDDGLLRRDVALKLPLFVAGSAVDRARFDREREVLASLDHPRIARVHDAGVSAAGQPYIVLEHVDGIPITRDAAARGLDLRARVALFLQVIAAVDHAHRHLVVHRDLKPSNILVDAEGRVKLLDFGIAKLLGDLPGAPGSASDAALTRDAGGCAVTARYAAPEQLDGGAITTATDVYALGVVLHELLTGRMPYGDDATPLAGWIDAVMHADPRPTDLPADLDVVLRQAMRKVPAERYASADAFAQDLRRWLEHRPVLAHRPGWLHRARLLVRRNRAASGIAALGLLAAVALSSAAWQQHRLTLQQRERADAVRDFMFDLVEGATDDDAHPGVEPTARQMIDAAVRRARDGFASNPRLQGEVLTELAVMRARLDDPAGAEALLQDGARLLQANAPDDDPALNKNRAQLAVLRAEAGRADEADAIARRVLAACRDGRDCAKARSYAHGVRAMDARRAGQGAEAEAEARARVRDCELAFGVADAETALAWSTLAIYAREAGDLEAALAAADRAVALGTPSLRNRTSRIEVFRTRALLSLDLGDFADAQARLRALLPQTRDPVEQALQWRLLATAALGQGRADVARDAAATALRLVDAKADDPERWFDRQALARARSLAGEAAQARADMDAVVAGLLALGYPEESMEVLRARRLRAEVDLRAGDVPAAERALAGIAARQERAGAGQRLELAQTQELLGCAARAAGRLDDAAAWHRRALAGFDEKKLPANHPWRSRNALYQGVTAWRAEPTTARHAELVRLAAREAARLPADSLWSGPSGPLAPGVFDAACTASQPARCLFLL